MSLLLSLPIWAVCNGTRVPEAAWCHSWPTCPCSGHTALPQKLLLAPYRPAIFLSNHLSHPLEISSPWSIQLSQNDEWVEAEQAAPMSARCVASTQFGWAPHQVQNIVYAHNTASTRAVYLSWERWHKLPFLYWKVKALHSQLTWWLILFVSPICVKYYIDLALHTFNKRPCHGC